jgi:quinol-cytochrome oxidoreductase complex cytochrome b subunit
MLKSLNMKDLREKTWTAVDNRVRAISAGLGLHELRNVMRGDPPAEKPNPRYKVHTTSFLFHIRPRYYEAGSTILSHTFRLGFFTSLFFFIELFTGLILMVYYTPSPEKAYDSILKLISEIPFGQLLRDIHRLGAEAMVIFTVLHMLRTFMTGSYKKERSFTWLTGVALLGITMFLSFSGYLLPWDQLAYWAVTVGTSMAEAAPLFGNEVNLLLRGSPDIAANGLLRFYLLHVVLLPLGAILVISIHYYKVSREHGISLPARFEEGEVKPEVKKAAKARIDFIPDLFTGEVFLTALGLLVVLLIVTVFGYHAPLESVANPQVTPLDTEAPWYFWWLQGMLKLGDKTLMGIVIPTLLVLLLVGLPYIDRNPYRSMWKRPWAVSIGILSVLVLIILSYIGLPEYGIKTDPATRIVQDMAPEEGVGPMREVPFDQMPAGVYIVNQTPTENMCPELDFGCPEFESAFALYGSMVNAAVEEGRLPEAEAVLVVDDWQQDLKRLTFRISWSENGTPKTYEKHIYLHRERGAE